MQNREPTTEDTSADNCLVGTLSTWPLADLLLWMHQSRRSAMVRIGSGLDAGVIFFREGTLFRCEWGSRHGEEALIALLDVEDGSFSIIQRQIPEARPNVRRATPELLLQCAVAKDERRRMVSA